MIYGDVCHGFTGSETMTTIQFCKQNQCQFINAEAKCEFRRIHIDENGKCALFQPYPNQSA